MPTQKQINVIKKKSKTLEILELFNMGNVWMSAPKLKPSTVGFSGWLPCRNLGGAASFQGGSGQPGISQSKVSGESGDKVYKLNELGEPSWEVVNRQKPITGSTDTVQECQGSASLNQSEDLEV